MSTQSNLNLTTKESGPVECLGQTFPSDEARREHYLKLLAEKLKDPEFRKIEGFPIGEDDDILALSDPPYYTACPNPWIGEFIEHYGRPYDPKEKYHREPFAADVSEGKNHPIYNAHSYHTKVPHRAIMRYILHYTDPGDVVFDGFCGTGMTGVAAALCGDRSEVCALGYRIDEAGNIFDESGNQVSHLGSRQVVLNDLSPMATFIADNYCDPVDQSSLVQAGNKLLEEIDTTSSVRGEIELGFGGTIEFVIWSDVLACPNCAEEAPFWDLAVNEEELVLKEMLACPKCSHQFKKEDASPAVRIVADPILGTTVKQICRMPIIAGVQIGSSVHRKRLTNKQSLLLIDEECGLQNLEIPNLRMIEGGETRRNDKIGYTHVHHYYFPSNLATIARWRSLAKKIGNPKIRKKLLFVCSGSDRISSRLASIAFSYYFHGGGGYINAGRKGTLYISSVTPEVPAAKSLGSRLKAVSKLSIPEATRVISTCSSTSLSSLPDACLDYVFVDPPFGSNIMYTELNFLWEAWLGVTGDRAPEAIEDKKTGKSLEDYRRLMSESFAEVFRALKPGRWVTVEFSNPNAKVWRAIQVAIESSGFVVANVSALNKKQGSIQAYTTTTAVKQDLVISAYKPNGGLEDRFKKSGHTPEGVWDFMKTHLRNLPVVIPRGGEMEFIAERDPRILHDRMVAFYIGHGMPVPLSSAEFQKDLAEKFPERDGMFFLPEQVTEWDKKRAQMEGVGQMSIFVEDEKSAIDWLRNFLKTRPSTYQDIQPEFMQQLGASWKKFETRPELSLLLEQNFLKYDGRGEVPSQIHSYLSTQFKDQRNLPKDSSQLQAKGKDRWFVPDPAKAVDVEAIRNKRLLQEFWDLCTEAGIARPSGPSAQRTLPLPIPATVKKTGRKKLKEVRTEAVRLGFKECFASKDYSTILAIAHHLPDNVIEEDEQLQMMHDMAEMRAQG